MKSLAFAALACLLLSGCSGSTSRPPAAGSSPAPGVSASATGASGPASTSAASGSATSGSAATNAAPSSTPGVPRFDHIVVVVEENHSNSEIVGDTQAPYMNALGRSGVVLTHSFGVAHPSEPNYVALFSGSTQRLTDDSCPHRYSAANLGSQLRSARQTFAGYSQSLPRTGYTGCTAGKYARKHAPWTDFANLPAAVNEPMTAFPKNYATLPRVSFVIPDLTYDMHDGTVRQADTWLKTNLGGYVSWARTHNSLLVLTWDEDDFTGRNQIPGMLAGAHLKRTQYAGRVDHYTMLRTIEAACGLPPIGAAKSRVPISGIWTA